MTIRPSALFGLYGAGGFAREAMPWMQSAALTWESQAAGKRAMTGYVQTERSLSSLGGLPVMSEETFLQMTEIDRYFNIAIADSAARERIAHRSVAQGVRPLSLISPHALVYPDATLGEGAILCAFSVVSSLAVVGKYFHANFHCYVAHDCIVGDFVTMGPRAICNGNVHIADHAYIGAGALIRQGRPGEPLRIGEGAVIGMGAVVTKDVPAHTTVIGNPARVLSR